MASESPEGMSDEDCDCYKCRYRDLGAMQPREHYKKVGEGQGR